jgi:hypothetical protein
MAEHLQTCVRCQAELSGYRRLLRVLRNMKDEPVMLPALTPVLVAETLSALQQRLAVRARRTTELWAVAGTMAVLGVAALGAGALITRAGRNSRTLVGAAA